MLTEEVRSLREKLPPEVFQDEGLIATPSKEAVSKLLEHAKGVLLQRILASGGGK